MSAACPRSLRVRDSRNVKAASSASRRFRIAHLPVTVQLTSSDVACFEATDPTTLQNTIGQFKARGD